MYRMVSRAFHVNVKVLLSSCLHQQRSAVDQNHRNRSAV
jgi:hypothetical protein